MEVHTDPNPPHPHPHIFHAVSERTEGGIHKQKNGVLLFSTAHLQPWKHYMLKSLIGTSHSCG